MTMEVDQFAAVLVKKIRVDLNNYADDLASGNARNYEDYRFTCGVIRGLAQAEEYIKDLAATAEKSDE